jgi:hypothetical protein
MSQIEQQNGDQQPVDETKPVVDPATAVSGEGST